MWPIRPPPAVWCWRGYIAGMPTPEGRLANGMLRRGPKSSSIRSAIARRTRCGVTDYMDTLMLGLSAKAREGDSLPRLLRPCGWQAWRWSTSCQPESSDGLSARHLDPLGGHPAVIVAQQAGDHWPNILRNAHPSQRRHGGKLRVNPASSRTSPPPKSVAIAPGRWY